MRLYVHQTLSSIPIIPFSAAGMVAGAYLAHRLGLWRESGALLDPLCWCVALVLMLAVGWVCSLPIQFVYDRLVSAECPACGAKKAYRKWPSIRWYRCRSCGADSAA